MDKKISIVTICYNSEATLEDTITSVIGQDYPNKEYVLIDGGSTDGTLEIIEKYRDQIDVVISEQDKGIYDAMNKGVKQSSGDIIGILNSDDFYAHPQVISKIAKRLSQHPDAKAIYADLLYVDQYDTDKVVRYWKSGEMRPNSFVKGWMPPHPTLFVDRTVYDTYGAYNLKLRSAADYEFMLRILHKEKVEVCYLPEVITKMRVGGQSNATLKNRLKANKEDRMAWELNGLTLKWHTTVRKPLSKIKQFWAKPPNS